jgi:hypothetical protein
MAAGLDALFNAVPTASRWAAIEVEHPNPSSVARFGRIDVGSTEASNGRLARFGRIDV